jgi:hypothetical protein
MSNVSATVRASHLLRSDADELCAPSPRQLVVTQKAQPGRRFIAAWAYDYLACFWLSIGVLGVLTFVAGSTVIQKVPLLVVTVLIFLTRDFFFEGRGVGKNFLGMQVLDVKTGRPPSLKQSVIRNFVLLGPFLVYQLFVAVSFFLPASTGELLVVAVKCAALIAGAILLPLEGYRMHSGYGIRLADKLAATVVVVSAPDFRNPFSLRRTTSSAQER